MVSPIVRYWIKLNPYSDPIETEDKIYVKNELKRSRSPSVIRETIYPNGHKFEFDANLKETIPGELSDAERGSTVTRMFNRASQFEKQVLRKKQSSAKPKSTRKR